MFIMELNKNLCLFCQKQKPTEKCTPATEAGFATIQESAKNRQNTIDTKYGAFLDQYLSMSINDVKHHAKCRSDFTNKTLISRLKRKTSHSESDNTTDTTNATDWSLCVVCQAQKNKDRLRPVSEDIAQRIEECGEKDEILGLRIRDTNLVVARVVYHSLCLLDLERRCSKISTIKIQHTAFNELCAEMRIVAGREVLKLEDIWQRFKKLCDEKNEEIPPSFVSRRSTFKQKLCESIGDLYYFHQPLDRDIHNRHMLLIPKKYLLELVTANDHQDDFIASNIPKVSNESDIMTIAHAALICRNHLSEHTVYNGVNVSKELARAVVPDNLVFFLSVLAEGQTAIDEYFDNNNEDQDTDGGDLRDQEIVTNYDDSDLDSDDDSDLDSDDDSNDDAPSTTTEVGDSEKENNTHGRVKENLSNRILSIAQDIVYVSSKGKRLTPKHVGLALTLHQKTRSKKLVSLFNKAGHCISYDQVLQIDRILAKLTLDSLDNSTGAVTPPNIVTSETAAKVFEGAVVPFVPVLHITADNIDLLTDTIDGKNTFHATQMVVFQRGGKSSDESLNSIRVKRGASRLEIPEILYFLPENQVIEEDPKFNSPVQLEWYNDCDSSEIKIARRKDFNFVYTRQDKPDTEKIGWTQFNKVYSTNNLPKTASGFMPLILNPAHEFNTLMTVLSRCIAVGDKLNYYYIVLTTDQQLFCKLLDVKWSSPVFQERIVLKMGGFHIACNFMKAIGDHMANTGLAEMWIESGLLSEGSTIKVLNGKAYAKAMRIHKLTYQALWRILLPKFLDFLETEHYIIFEQISNMSYDDILSMVVLENCEIEKYIQIFFNRESKKNVNISFWLTYMESVSILLMFTRSIRDANWELYLSCLTKMLPLIARYDHYNYLKSMTVYIAEMKQLPKIVGTAFKCGDFVIKKTDAKFNHVDADHAQEWLVGTSKDAGGISGITNKDATLQRWALSFHWRTNITEKTFSMYGLESNVGKHNEETPGRRKRDICDENTLLKYLQHLKVFSEDVIPNQLQNAVTKDVATKEIEASLLSAYEEGHKEVVKFVKERLILQENNTTTTSYNEKMSRVNAPTMTDLFKPVPKIISEKKLKNVDSKFLQRLTMAYEAGREIDLKSILKHELHNFPISLADTNGNLRSCDQTPLFNHLKKEVNCHNSLPLNNLTSQLIVNGTEMMADIKKLSTIKTFGDYANNFVSQLKQHSWNYARVDVLFDHSKDHIVRVRNCQKRAKLFAPIRRIIENENVPLPQNMTNFLSLASNKADLSKFLCEKLAVCDFGNVSLVVSGGFVDRKRVTSSINSLNTLPLAANHEYAKTRIVIHAINSEADKIVVESKDIEVLLLLIHHFDKMLCKELWLKAGTLKKRLYIPVHSICETLDENLKENILSYHFLTGSTYTSSVYGVSKVTGWTVYENNAKLLAGLGLDLLSSECLTSTEEFFVKLFKVDEDIKSADLARHFLFSKLKNFTDLPPTSDALKLHIQRSHHQTKMYKNSHLPNLPPEDYANHGWRIDENNEFVPILMTLAAIPSSCEDMTQCGCPKGKCSNNRCKCHKKGVPCMAVCNCAGICNNPSLKRS